MESVKKSIQSFQIKRNKKQSIVRQWLFRSMSIIVLVLIFLEIISVSLIRSYYYTNASSTLETRMSYFFASLNSDNKGIGRDEELNRAVKNFEAKDIILAIALDGQGNAVVTSSGFPPQGEWASQPNAVRFSGEQSDIQVQKINGEPVMTITQKVPNGNSRFYAVQFSISLSLIDQQIMYFLAIITVLCLVVIFLVVFSSAYFIRSIVIPVTEVSEAARRIALGDFSARLDIASADEIGELCENINYMADELSQAEDTKNEFISSVSHELRTPLTAIRGWAETVSMMGAEEPAMLEKGMGVILGETERLGGMVEELLDFSRMQSGHFSLILEKMDAVAELEETVLVFEERARREGVELILDTDQILPPVMGDKNRIRQVFVNILDNALKYTDSGDQITASAILNKEGKIQIQIIDTGCGIPSEDLTRVKERFYKGKGARRGSGIGLSVVEEIVSRHHGIIEIDSTEQEGTTVTITLPTYEQWNSEGYEAQ